MSNGITCYKNLPKVIKSYQKLSKMQNVQNCQHGKTVSNDGPKRSKNCQTLPKMTQNCSELPTTVEARPLNRPHQASKPAPPHSAKVKMTNVTIYADRKDVTKATDGGGEGSTGNASIQYIYLCPERH